MVPPKWQRQAYAVYQSLMMSVPKLSEGRLATERTLAFLKAWHYISRARIQGDYLEFGVFEGQGFKLALQAASKFLKPRQPDSPRFFAFDSFEGLPDLDVQRDGNVYEKGEYSAGRKTFEKACARAGKPWEIHVIPGFFEDSLTPELLTRHRMAQAAFVVIDCDVYPSTLQALRFVSSLLHTGTVLFFDDWFFSGGDLTLGEPGACLDWLKENDDLHLVDYGTVGIMGKLFIVNRLKDPGDRDLLNRMA